MAQNIKKSLILQGKINKQIMTEKIHLDLIFEAKSFFSKILFEYGAKLISAVIILYIGWKLINLLNKGFLKLLEKKEVDKAVGYFLSRIINIALKMMLIISVMTHIGIEMTSFIAMIGAAGLAVGMALQGTLQNFAGGVIVLVLKPFKLGDFIESGSYAGTVERIQIFNTHLLTSDRKTVIVPNSELATKSLINHTKAESRRVEINIGVSYGENVEQIRQIMLNTVKADARIQKNPNPVVVVTHLSESSITISLRAWTTQTDYWDIYFEYTEKIYNELLKNQITNPLPKMQVQLRQN